MQNLNLHTPEGVRDIYNGEYQAKECVTSAIRNEIARYGYMSIATPSFEFFDTFSKEVGTTPSKDIYKFFDKEGNTLVLRPDMTPAVARAYAMYFNAEGCPMRLTYEGNVYTNHHSHQGRLNESTQIGAEIMGYSSVEADAEILALAIKAILATGLDKLLITVGHAGFFNGLMDVLSLKHEVRARVCELVTSKNYFGAMDVLEQNGVDGKLMELFEAITLIYDSPEQWDKVVELAKPFENISTVLDYLKKLYDALKPYGVERYVSFELSLPQNYSYYTGMIFSGYTYGSGEPIVMGGRYDKLLSNFGCDAPAMGFAIYVDRLLSAMLSQKKRSNVDEKYLAVYSEECYNVALEYAFKLRDEGKNCMLLPLSAYNENGYRTVYGDADIKIFSEVK